MKRDRFLPEWIEKLHSVNMSETPLVNFLWINKYSIKTSFYRFPNELANTFLFEELKNTILQSWNYLILTYLTNGVEFKLLLSISLRKRLAERDWPICRGRMDMTVKQIRVLIQGLGQGKGTTKELWPPGLPLSLSTLRLNLV